MTNVNTGHHLYSNFCGETQQLWKERRWVLWAHSVCWGEPHRFALQTRGFVLLTAGRFAADSTAKAFLRNCPTQRGCLPQLLPPSCGGNAMQRLLVGDWELWKSCPIVSIWDTYEGPWGPPLLTDRQSHYTSTSLPPPAAFHPDNFTASLLPRTCPIPHLHANSCLRFCSRHLLPMTDPFICYPRTEVMDMLGHPIPLSFALLGLQR